MNVLFLRQTKYKNRSFTNLNTKFSALVDPGQSMADRGVQWDGDGDQWTAITVPQNTGRQVGCQSFTSSTFWKIFFFWHVWKRSKRNKGGSAVFLFPQRYLGQIYCNFNNEMFSKQVTAIHITLNKLCIKILPACSITEWFLWADNTGLISALVLFW